jgi:alpha-galactosidase
MNKQKIVLIGAGSVQFGLGTVGCILESEHLRGSEIVLHDINEDALNVVEKACLEAIEERNLETKLSATIDRQKSLEEANFVINAIEVGPRFGLWDEDYKIPVKIGNKQIFGENGGPGGLFHSLRIIPPILEICGDIKRICPDALVFSFSNPMSRICLAVKRQYPSLKFIGLCHEIAFARWHLPIMLDTPLANLDIKAGGLNHFGVVLQARYKDSGKDAYPKIREIGDEYLKGIDQHGGYRLIRYILKNYDFLPYTSDCHYGEYIQWAWDIADHKNVRRFKKRYFASLTKMGETINKVIEEGKGSTLVRNNHERAIPMIEAYLGLSPPYEEMSVNVPNDGVFTNLPEDLVVECPVMVEEQGIHPVKFGEYPKGLAALLRNHASVLDLTAEAAIQKSKKIALQALLADPVIFSTSNAEKILEKMIKTQKSLSYLK